MTPIRGVNMTSTCNSTRCEARSDQRGRARLSLALPWPPFGDHRANGTSALARTTAARGRKLTFL